MISYINYLEQLFLQLVSKKLLLLKNSMAWINTFSVPF